MWIQLEAACLTRECNKKSRGTISKGLTSQKIRGDPAYKWFPTPLRIITSSHNDQLTSSPAHIITMSQHHLQLCQTLHSGSAAWVWDLIGKSSEWFVKGRIACAACWPQRVDVKTISSCKCSVRPACRQDLFATFYYCNAIWCPCVWQVHGHFVHGNCRVEVTLVEIRALAPSCFSSPCVFHNWPTVSRWGLPFAVATRCPLAAPKWWLKYAGVLLLLCFCNPALTLC